MFFFYLILYLTSSHEEIESSILILYQRIPNRSGLQEGNEIAKATYSLLEERGSVVSMLFIPISFRNPNIVGPLSIIRRAQLNDYPYIFPQFLSEKSLLVGRVYICTPLNSSFALYTHRNDTRKIQFISKLNGTENRHVIFFIFP